MSIKYICLINIQCNKSKVIVTLFSCFCDFTFYFEDYCRMRCLISVHTVCHSSSNFLDTTLAGKLVLFIFYGNYGKELRCPNTYGKYGTIRSGTSKDSDQPLHPPSMARVLLYPSLDSFEAVEGRYDKWNLWSDCTNTQADLSLRLSHESYCRSYCHSLARFLGIIESLLIAWKSS